VSITLLSEIAALHMASELQEIVLRRLASSDFRIATEAAAFLAGYGSAASEQAAWQRYREWSRDWSGRAAESLASSEPGELLPTFTARDLGCQLANTLATARGWLADRDMLERIQTLMPVPDCREHIRQQSVAWFESPGILFVPAVPETFSLARADTGSSAPPQTSVVCSGNCASLLFKSASEAPRTVGIT